MSKLNNDGLAIGQPVDFETINKIERARKNADTKPESKAKSPRKSAKKAKDE